MKCLHLLPGPWTQGHRPDTMGVRWKPALNAFAITFADRMPAAENL
jgi:putative transposase